MRSTTRVRRGGLALVFVFVFVFGCSDGGGGVTDDGGGSNGTLALASIGPAVGPVSGGTAFTLVGAGFASDTSVTFDGAAATSIVVVDATTITGTTPAGAAGPADVVVAAGTGMATLPDGFTYVVAGAPLTPIFASSFGATTGTTTAAVSDGGRWHVYGTSGVVLANPHDLGFPQNMPNILKVSWSVATSIWRVGPPFGAGFPTLAVGSTRYYRYYFRQVQPDATVDTQTHPVQDGSGGSQTNWSMQCFNNVGAGVWKLGHGFWGNPFPYDQFHLQTLLDKRRTYRLEHAIERVTDTTFRFDTRVFDESVSAVTPIYDGDDFFAGGDPARGSMTEYFATQTLTFNNAQNLDGINAGVNDIDPNEPGDYAYQGGFAVVEDQGWIGPYGSVAGEQ